MRAMPSFFAGNRINPATLQGTFSRFFGARSLRRPPEQPPQRRKILFESLEPRLLLSADFIPVAPVGSLIHQASENGELAGASATASYTLALDAEQKISVVFSTTDADL
ncbi:LEPR-XLL domain-containing protein, partial [Accumulibacter sp.]|uniref:LEPR-XLL domain-containing protein n=1 Tax=Accumulibacter sp. TaxID=2053492 RepID=UPI001A388493